ncbi:MAG TPA: Uma2 family endonuclease [Oculatellaceae cyanobacterium]|jgi:Uma2 family endonuclease
MTVSTSIILQSQEKSFSEWKNATWQDYIAFRNNPHTEILRLFYYQNKLLVEMGTEGINHATICDLFTLVFGFWFSQNPGQIFSSLGGCLLEKPPKQAAAPDLVLYLGGDFPRWKPGERRYINLNQWRVPNLVGEIADTTLATDLDEKKHLYAELGIPEYWVIDVRGQWVFAFQLQENGVYQECEQSLTLAGLPIDLLNQTLSRLNEEANGSAAIWFAQQIANLKAE